MAKEWREFVMCVPAGVLVGGIIGTLIGVEHFENPYVSTAFGAVLGGVVGIAIARSRSD